MDGYQISAVLLALTLMALLFGYAFRVTAVGDEVGTRLDELAADGTGITASVKSADRYARFEHRDYSGERGPTPTLAPRYATIYDEVCARLGVRPC